ICSFSWANAARICNNFLLAVVNSRIFSSSSLALVQSFVNNAIACIKVDVLDRDRPAVPSVCSVWRGAWMQECETYDLFGIRFEGHPNLHRILLWDGYPGWPLRKDFLSMPGGLQPGLDEFSGTKRREPPPVSVVE
ncbi:NADH-quinone oxidoreductase subunit C, partial [bacterium]